MPLLINYKIILVSLSTELFEPCSIRNRVFWLHLFALHESKDNMYNYPLCSTSPGSWWKIQCRWNTIPIEKITRPGLSNDIIYKIRPIFLDLSKNSELEKCLHGKTQNANESFYRKIWEHIPKNAFVTLPNLEF